MSNVTLNYEVKSKSNEKKKERINTVNDDDRKERKEKKEKKKERINTVNDDDRKERTEKKKKLTLREAEN